jgi:hypothetical protein
VRQDRREQRSPVSDLTAFLWLMVALVFYLGCIFFLTALLFGPSA